MVVEFLCDNQPASNAYVSEWVGIERTAYNYTVFFKKTSGQILYNPWPLKEEGA